MNTDELRRRALETVYNILANGARELQLVVHEDNYHEESIVVAREAHAIIIHMLYANNQDQTSKLVAHARRELEIINEDETFAEHYLEIIRLFAAQGHSGDSSIVFIPTLQKLLNFENLGPISNDPIEWNEVGNGMWQNTRNSKFFSEDGGKSFYDVDDKYHIDGSVKLIKPAIDIHDK